MATKSEVIAVENKIPSVGNLVKKSKITELRRIVNEPKHGQYITTSEFNKFFAKLLLQE